MSKHLLVRTIIWMCCLLVSLGSTVCVIAQSDTATLSGRVGDPGGRVLTGALIELVDIDRGSTKLTHTNDSGLYLFTDVRPSHYRMQVSSPGFRTVNLANLIVNIQDSIDQNFSLAVGAVSESITVQATGTPVENSAAVSTTVDRQLVAELPLNGRSFQTLFQLTPGVVTTGTDFQNQGQFSVNGQRSNANYFQVDGVSANVGIAAGGGHAQSLGGSIPALTAAGGTNGLVATDAMQEFVIQTSGYAPEYGRTPGAQVAITTRSGSNEYHGETFDYLRNDIFDANDWFANHNNLKRAALRQNDFGGVVGGPIISNRTFFFLSYEGLRLRQPKTGLSDVPDLISRQTAPLTIQPYLDTFPLPTGFDEGNGLAPANYTFSEPSGLNAGSIRLDQRAGQHLSLFARYNYSSSFFKQRGAGIGVALNDIGNTVMKLHTATAGMSWLFHSNLVNDLRFNWSWSSGSSYVNADSLGGAHPLDLTTAIPANQSVAASTLFYEIDTGLNTAVDLGRIAANLQKQINLVDLISLQRGKHLFKTGIDFRRLTPNVDSASYGLFIDFPDMPSILGGTPNFAEVTARGGPVNVVYDNYSVFLQDSWRATPRLTLTYGVRWDYNPSPSGSDDSGHSQLSIVDTGNLSTFQVGPPGASLYHATRDNFAPRLGVAYRAIDGNEFGSVLSLGYGVFYDLGNGPTGAVYSGSPFVSRDFRTPQTFPLSANDAAPPQVTLTPPFSDLYAFPRTLRQPYTYHWNLEWRQSLGAAQIATVSYLGAAGHSLLNQEVAQFSAPSNFGTVFIVDNSGHSNYNAFQAQFKRRQSNGVEILAAYTYAHSLDNISTDVSGNPSSAQFDLDPNANYSSSDFDIRHTGSIAIDFEPSYRPVNRWMRALLSGWGLNTLMNARSGPVVDVAFGRDTGQGFFEFRPDLRTGTPLYISDGSIPGGRRIDPNAFAIPTSVRQGNLGRNALQGFPLVQQDISLRRSFRVRERIHLQARVEAFNIFNHPSFAPPSGALGFDFGGSFIPLNSFGISQSMLGTGLRSGGFGSGFSPLYQIGGPRSLQLALRLEF